MIASPDTFTFNKEGWTWRLRDSSILDPWFSNFLEGHIEEPIRSTSGKDVFRVVSYDRHLIVHCYHPKRTFSKLKSRVVPRAKAEYEAHLLLEDMEIPSAECLGWGRRGPDSIIISRELPNSMSAYDFWFSNMPEDETNLRQPFLLEFARFLSRFLTAGLYHPDMRLHRLSVSGDPFLFQMVEPYGLVKPPCLDDDMKYQMLRTIGELRGEINTGEAAAIILFTGVEQEAEKTVALWRRILKDEAANIDGIWPKRRRQIIACDPRFCIVAEGLLLRCSMGSLPLLAPEELSANILDRFEMMDFQRSPDEALHLWLLSFKLTLHRIGHRRPILMETGQHGRPHALHFERSSGVKADGQPALKDFIERCILVGITPEELEDNIEIVDGRPLIDDIRRLRLEA